jgi:endogenous inhibitor of DNA gyrase (YacG/DUF329 family)
VIDITWSKDSEHVTCPSCRESWADLWDYDWTHREEIRIECPHCGKPLTLHRSISVDYGVSQREAT